MSQKLERQIYTELRYLREHQKTQRSKKVAFMLLIAIILGMSHWISTKSPSQQSTALSVSTPDPSLKALPLPLSGTITPARRGDSFFGGKLRLFLSPPSKADNSKLDNHCPANALQKKNDLNYFLKVVDFESKKTITTAFIRAGETITLDLPSGNYKLRYAAGVQWYGEQNLFGTRTRYGEVVDLTTSQPLQLKFERGGTAWDLGLYGCSFGGNTSSKTLNSQDF